MTKLAVALALPWLSASSSVLAHGKDHVVPDSASERAGSVHRDISPSGRVQTRQAQPVVSPAQGGLWSAVEPWPLVAIHAALLPNGKVLAWDATPDDADEDPRSILRRLGAFMGWPHIVRRWG